MKKICVFTVIFMIMIFQPSCGQKGYYFGLEGLHKMDNFVYLSENGHSFNVMALGLHIGGYIGRKYEYFNAELGFYRHFIVPPGVAFNYETNTASSDGSWGGVGTAMLSSLLCVSVGHDFRHKSRRFFLKPDLGFLISRVDPVDYDSPTISQDLNLTSETDDTYTVYKRHVPSRFSFGIESNLEFGYRVKNKFDFYLKGLVQSYFQSPCMFTIKHYSGSDIQTAIMNYNGISVSIQLGIRYYFGRQFKS